MPLTRRRVLLGSSAAVALLSGCARFGDSAATVAELEVELANETDDRHAFHFAVETTDGLGEWESREVAPGTSESVVREPAKDYDPVAIHGVVDEHPTRGELRILDGVETGDVCLHIIFHYGPDGEPTFLESTNVRC